MFVDPIFVPHQFPLQDGQHVVFFSNTNRSELFEKLDYYRANVVEARRIAANGYLFAMKYHRTVNLMDYIMRTVHMRQVQLQLASSMAAAAAVGAVVGDQASLPNYVYTGQYLNYEARAQEEMIQKCHRPGIYEPPRLFGNRSGSGSSDGSGGAAVGAVGRRLSCSVEEQARVRQALQLFQQQQEAERIAEEAAEAAAKAAAEAAAAAIAAGQTFSLASAATPKTAAGDVDVTKIEPPLPGFARNINFSRR